MFERNSGMKYQIRLTSKFSKKRMKMTLDRIKMHQTDFDNDVSGRGETNEDKENDNLSEPKWYKCALAKRLFP